jgi:nucleoside-diphosphate-sugar epimerase
LDTGVLSESLVIFGCGYVGLALAKECLGQGWAVTALTRNPDTAKQAEQLGASAILGNLQETQWWGKIPTGVDHVVNCVGASSPTLEGYEQSYLQGMQSILAWMEQGGKLSRSLVFTSSSSVYPQTDGSLVNEEADTSESSARAHVLLSAEKLCLEASPTIAQHRSVVRFSGLYGPGRHLLVDKIERGEPMTGSSERFLNLLHRDDASSSVLALLQAPPGFTGGVFNACDGQHATRGEIARWVAQRLGVTEPVFTGSGDTRGGHRRVDPSKAFDVLGWKPKFPNFQSGYEDFLASKIG